MEPKSRHCVNKSGRHATSKIYATTTIHTTGPSLVPPSVVTTDRRLQRAACGAAGVPPSVHAPPAALSRPVGAWPCAPPSSYQQQPCFCWAPPVCNPRPLPSPSDACACAHTRANKRVRRESGPLRLRWWATAAAGAGAAAKEGGVGWGEGEGRDDGWVSHPILVVGDDALEDVADALPRLGRRLEDVGVVLRRERVDLLLAHRPRRNLHLDQVGCEAAAHGRW